MGEDARDSVKGLAKFVHPQIEVNNDVTGFQVSAFSVVCADHGAEEQAMQDQVCRRRLSLVPDSQFGSKVANPKPPRVLQHFPGHGEACRPTATHVRSPYRVPVSP